MHAFAIAVGTDGTQHVGAVVGVAEAIGLACRDQACGQCGGNAGAKAVVVVAWLLATGLFAGTGTGHHAWRGAVRADGDAGRIAPRKFLMGQCRARIEQGKTYALAGQSTCIGVIGPHRTQPPVSVEFIAAPTGCIAGVAENGRVGRRWRGGRRCCGRADAWLRPGRLQLALLLPDLE